MLSECFFFIVVFILIESQSKFHCAVYDDKRSFIHSFIHSCIHLNAVLAAKGQRGIMFSTFHIVPGKFH